ncbi:MAG: hypothetical protein PWR19_1995 [Carnobacterium sp.]|uniref:glycosyltransferase family 4 protein n=1 Tax=Carnobacterium sp. TaxID=48221 RepID=UPI002648EFBE|nr:glycosyltransferase family 4 protein [Carnobacterium sp.]MDN5372949.1 hypothetical protein [Carnobacterium sp.]
MEEHAILINYTGTKGGGAQYAYEMAKGFVTQNVNTIAIISSSNENIKQWRELPLNKLIVLDTYLTSKELITKSILWNKKYKNKILEELKGWEIDVVYTPMITFWTKNINQLFPRAKSIVVLHDPKPHSNDKNKRALQLFGETAVLKKADAIIVLSNIFKDFVAEKYNKVGKVFQIPHGPLNIYKDSLDKVTTVKYDPTKTNFLFFGTISKYKGIGVLAEAYKIVSQTEKNVTLTIAGSGDFTEYESMYQNLPNVQIYNRWILNEEVESFFIGENLIAVLPYLDATQSGVIPVGVSYAVPIIASASGGLIEQLKDYNTGVLVEPNNAIALAEQMITLANNPEKRLEMKEQAEKNSQKNNWTQATKKVLNIINQV